MNEMEKSMRLLFNESQTINNHNKSIKQLIKLQNKSNTSTFLNRYYKELIRNIKITLHCDCRSPFTNNIIDFIIKYLVKFLSLNAANKDTSITLIDTVLTDIIKPYLSNVKVECRVNACHFVRKLSDVLIDINENLYKSIKVDLIQRFADKVSSVRAAAILAAHRFQDITQPNDIAIIAIQFHLKNDPDCDVRHACLQSLAPNKFSLSHFIDATRDVKDVIRKTAFAQIADNLNMKHFSIEQRLIILKNGLKDRSIAVKKIVETKLIPSWVKSCNNDLIQLLISLDIQTDPSLIEQMLDIYFKYLNREKYSDEHWKTKFHILVEEFVITYLNEQRIMKVALTVENVFLWRFLAEFCKNNQIVIQVEDDNIATLPPNESENSCEDISGEKCAQTTELIDVLIPDVPYYCSYLNTFIDNIISQSFTMEDLMDFEFIYTQLMQITLLFDIRDDAQRKELIRSLKIILIEDEIEYKFHDYISPIMKCLSTLGFPDKSEYLDFTVEVISDIFAAILPTSDETDNIDANNFDYKEAGERINKLTAEYNNYKDDLSEAHDESDANSIKVKMDELQIEITRLKDKTQSANDSSSQSSSAHVSLTDYPKQLLRCLNIFSGCLEFGFFNEINVVMQTHIEKLCMPGILSEDENLRIIATRCLGLVCLICPNYFKKYFRLLLEVFLNDLHAIKVVALKSIFDSLCEHGVNIFQEKGKEGKDKDKVETQNKVKELKTNDYDVEQNSKLSESDDYMSYLITFLDAQLDNESDEIKYITAQGIAKLLILGKIYSSQLLSRLVIMWFNPSEKQPLLQFIGEFIRVYAFAESQGVIVGQSALEEAFVSTLEIIYDDAIDYVNIDHLIKFFLNIIAEESHAKIVLPLANKILNVSESKPDFVEEYLLPSLSYLNLIELEANDLINFDKLIKEIEILFASSKNAAKKISVINEKIATRTQQIRADSTFAGDFASIDANDQNSGENNDEIEIDKQSLDDKNSIEENDTLNTSLEENAQHSQQANNESNTEHTFQNLEENNIENTEENGINAEHSDLSNSQETHGESLENLDENNVESISESIDHEITVQPHSSKDSEIGGNSSKHGNEIDTSCDNQFVPTAAKRPKLRNFLIEVSESQSTNINIFIDNVDSPIITCDDDNIFLDSVNEHEMAINEDIERDIFMEIDN